MLVDNQVLSRIGYEYTLLLIGGGDNNFAHQLYRLSFIPASAVSTAAALFFF